MRYLMHALLAAATTLFAAGCQPSIHDIVGREDLETAQKMIGADPGLLDARNNLGKTPLHYAVTYGTVDLLDFLIAKGADLNAADNTGMTPLHTAAMIGRTEEAERLLKAGANLEACDTFGDTPLHLAAIHNQKAMVELLLDAGADPKTVNNEKLTPLDLARRYRRAGVISGLAPTNTPQSIDRDSQNTER